MMLKFESEDSKTGHRIRVQYYRQETSVDLINNGKLSHHILIPSDNSKIKIYDTSTRTMIKEIILNEENNRKGM